MHTFINGAIITEEKAYIHIQDRGFLLGDGLFETLKVQNGHIEFFNAHFDRLSGSAKELSIPFHYKLDALEKICMELISLNELSDETAALRITLTRGAGLRGINLPENPTPSLIVTTAKYHANKNSNSRVFITNIKRNQFSPIVKLKTLNYLEPILARNEAQAHGYDEGVMLNTDGFITECSIANIFFITNNIVSTPSIESGILPGIVRNHIINLCHKNKIKVIEKKISVEEALDADEVFQTNSLIGIQSLSQINEKKLAVGDFTVFQKILKYYENSESINATF